MRVLVTGADGFVGRHLCRFLEKSGDQVTAAEGPEGSGEVTLNITSGKAVRAVLEEHRPDGIIHLAGLSSVSQSHAQPALAFEVNALGTVHLLAAIKESCPKARLLLVGSGEMYGPTASGARAKETDALRPTNPYAASKLAAEQAALQFARSYSLDVVCARPFNHLGPGQAPNFVVPSFATQLRAIGAGESPVIKVGDLTPVRDFSHVSDVVAAYRLLLTQGVSGQAYNICSGEGHSIRSILDTLIDIARLKVSVEVDPSRLRPSELPVLIGDPTKLERLGWSRKHTVRQALSEVLENIPSPAAGAPAPGDAVMSDLRSIDRASEG